MRPGAHVTWQTNAILIHINELEKTVEQELMLLTLVKHIKSYLKWPSVFLISICL
jgi:hypothetical protein